MSPSRLYPSGFRLFRRSRRFSSIRTSTLSMSSGSCCFSSRNFRNSGRYEDTRFFHFTFLSNLMWPLRARMVSVPKRHALFNGVPLGAVHGVVRVSLKPAPLHGARVRTALTIAGSDSGGGAGIQADLKSFASVGVHGTSVITCVTAQNTRTVGSIFPIPTAEIRKQLHAVLVDFDVRAAKTGMLFSAAIVRTVADELRRTRFPVVVDPVMVATVGARLEQDDFRGALVGHLLQRATLVTPNRQEAERLSGIRIATVDDMDAAARAIGSLGPKAVLLKGGHMRGPLVDVFYDGERIRHLRGRRLHKELHGAGCTLAASAAAYLALGQPLLRAVESARRKVALGIRLSYLAGQGVEIIDSHATPSR